MPLVVCVMGTDIDASNTFSGDNRGIVGNLDEISFYSQGNLL